MTDRRYLLAAVACFAAAGMLWAEMTSGQTPQDPSELIDWTIKADDTASIVGLEDAAEYWKQVTLTGNGNQCPIFEFVEASAALDEFIPRPETGAPDAMIYRTPLSPAEALRIEADRIEREAAAIARWRKALGSCAKAILGEKR